MVKSHAEWGNLKDDDLQPLLDGWLTRLNSEKPREDFLHAYIAKHAKIAFWDKIGFATVISKLRLGADFITDFVVVYDNWSNGIHYKLIEIEKPQMPPYTKEGIPSSGLSRALQQILSWQAWLKGHPSEAKKLFPSRFHDTKITPTFSYQIIIGNRENSKLWLDRRRMLSESTGISIVSFDHITPRFSNTMGFRDYSDVGDEKYSMSLSDRNNLACPFVKALSDPAWRSIVRNGRHGSDHFMHAYGDLLRDHQVENEYANRFRRILSESKKTKSGSS